MEKELSHSVRAISAVRSAKAFHGAAAGVCDAVRTVPLDGLRVFLDLLGWLAYPHGLSDSVIQIDLWTLVPEVWQTC